MFMGMEGQILNRKLLYTIFYFIDLVLLISNYILFFKIKIDITVDL
jgi:hypothetical protein